MKNQKKDTTPNAADLRQRADAAVATWREAKAASEAASKRWNVARTEAEKKRPAGNSLSSETRLTLIDLEVQRLEAEEVALAAEANASAALDAAERAEGDALAVECAPPRVHDEIAALLAEEDRLRAALAEASMRAVSRLVAVHQAEAKWIAQRSGAGLPAPARIPPHTTALGIPAPREVVVSLARIIAEGRPRTSYTQKIAQLRREEIEIRADLERRHREAEERKRRDAAIDRQREEERKRAAERQRREHAEAQARYDAERQRERELAEAHRAR